MDKEYIIKEIKRTAKENGGKPLGTMRFAKETGIKRYDWYPKYWKTWSDVLLEAGFEPNVLQQAYREEFLIKKLIDLIDEIGKFPTHADIGYKSYHNRDFPNYDTFVRRVGKKHEMAKKVAKYCEKIGGLSDVVKICLPIIKSKAQKSVQNEVKGDNQAFGYVYLMKSGKYYKIGKSNSPGRREYEISIKLPEQTKLLHQIKTDDPEGIEQYWHNRFGDKRKGGEWFALSRKDINDFKRRKFM